MPAKIPLEWLKPEPKRIRDIAPGESGYAHAGALDIDADGSVYLFLNARLEHPEGNQAVKVSRDAGGRYHVDLNGLRREFSRSHLAAFLVDATNFAPVDSLTL